MATLTWEQALDLMEAELHAPIGEVDPWTDGLPADPIPAHLVERAQTLAEAQAKRMAALRIGQEQVREQLAVLDLVPSDRGATAAYVDVVA